MHNLLYCLQTCKDIYNNEKKSTDLVNSCRENVKKYKYYKFNILNPYYMKCKLLSENV